MRSFALLRPLKLIVSGSVEPCSWRDPIVWPLASKGNDSVSSAVVETPVSTWRQLSQSPAPSQNRNHGHFAPGHEPYMIYLVIVMTWASPQLLPRSAGPCPPVPLFEAT